MDDCFDTEFKYLEETKYINNEGLLEQLQKIKGKVVEDFISSGSNFKMASESNEELLNAINECATDLISLMKLYKFLLKNEGKRDLGSFSYEGDQFHFINDCYMSAYLSMLPKGTELKMNFCNDDG